MHVATARRTWEVEIDPATGKTSVMDPVTHKPGPETVTLSSGDQAVWKCSSGGIDFDFELKWEESPPPGKLPGPPDTSLVASESWTSGKLKNHHLRRSQKRLHTNQTYKYTVTVYGKNGSTVVRDPDMVMDTN